VRKGKEVVPPRRGEIYVVRFDPTVGAEIRKTRPAVILQNDIANCWSPVTIVAALTSQFSEPLYPAQVLIPRGGGGLPVDPVVLLNQIRTMDKRHLVRKVGSLKPDAMAEVDRALGISLGLVKL